MNSQKREVSYEKPKLLRDWEGSAEKGFEETGLDLDAGTPGNLVQKGSTIRVAASIDGCVHLLGSVSSAKSMSSPFCKEEIRFQRTERWVELGRLFFCLFTDKMNTPGIPGHGCGPPNLISRSFFGKASIFSYYGFTASRFLLKLGQPLGHADTRAATLNVCTGLCSLGS